MKDEDVASRLIRDYEAQLKREPENMKLVRNIAELLTQQKDFDKALASTRALVIDSLTNNANGSFSTISSKNFRKLN